MRKTKFALYFGNRGFFPGELLASARDEMTKAVERAGYVSLVSATAYYTSNDEINALTVWVDEEQSVKGNRVIWSLPESASHCYLTMTDSRGLCVSTLLISYLE